MEVMVFPLGHSLLYPSFSKPFHIYEPRYIHMVEDSIASKTPIAVASVLEPSQSHEYKFGEVLGFVHAVVGYGMAQIVDRNPDGSLVVFLQGQGKARLGRVLDKKTPYLVCEASELAENHNVEREVEPMLLTAHRVMVHWLKYHIPDPRSRENFLNYVKTPEQVVGCYASYLVSDSDLQQLLLESNDINEKLVMINRMIESGELVS
jgi:ATP-dependent Lon protease